MSITAINVFIEMDGKQFIAPVQEGAADLFLGMLATCQSGNSSSTRLVPLHDDIAKHLLAARRAIVDRIQFLEAEKQKAMNKKSNAEGGM